MKKRLLKFALFGILLILVVGGVIFFVISRSGSSSVESWIGTQIQLIANSYINPTLSFTDLDYQYPKTVSLKKFKLRADDPAHPGQKIDILGCDSASVTLGQIPSVGQPIIIEKIVFDHPLISAVAVAPGSQDFIGFSNLMRTTAKPADAKTPASTAATPKLSEVFQMKLLQLIDGKIVYDPRIAGTVPMALDQINTSLNIAATDPGWYKLDTSITRKPFFNLAVTGQLNLDSFSVRDFTMSLLADLSAEKLDYLPPELQQLLKQYEGRGKLNIKVTGAVPIMDPMKGQAEAEIKLESAHVALGDVQVPVDNLDLIARFQDGKLTLPSLKINALNGTVDISGSTTLNDRLDADLKIVLAGIMPERLLTQSEMTSKFPGKLDLELNIAGSLMSLIGQGPPVLAGTPLAAINLKSFHFSADDPVNPGKRVDVLGCENLAVTITQPVISGKPLVIDEIAMTRPVISAISTEPGSWRFAGIPALPTEARVSSTAPAVVTLPVKFSDMVRVKSLKIDGAQFAYDPQYQNQPRMVLDGMTTSVTIDPADASNYQIAAHIARPPGLDLSIGGQFNLDTLWLRDMKLALTADLSQQPLDYLPPQVRVMVKQVGDKGKLNVQLAASAPISDPQKGTASANVRIDNVEIQNGPLHVPIDHLAIAAELKDGKVQLSNIELAALKSVFNVSGSTVLNGRMDTDLTLKLNGVVVEDVMAALALAPQSKYKTRVDAEIGIQTPIMVALGGVAGTAGEPAATVSVRNVKFTTDDPVAPGQPLDFFACKEITLALRSIPTPGQPLLIDRVIVNNPNVRAVAIVPNAPDLAGIYNLQQLAAGPTTAPAATQPKVVASTQAPPQTKLSDLVRLQLFEVNDMVVYYDPRVVQTIPMTLDHVSFRANADPSGPNIYGFSMLAAQDQSLNVQMAGRFDINTLTVNGLAMSMSADLGTKVLGQFPPQIQTLLKQYQTEGKLIVAGSGTMPLTDPMAADLQANIRLDNVKATVSDFRIPVDHVRIPAHLKNGQVEIQQASTTMGGPMIEALKGSADLVGTVTLNDNIDSTIHLTARDMLLQDLMADQFQGTKRDLVGNVFVEVKLTNAPLMVIAAKATPPTLANATGEPSPLTLIDLPENWGSATIEITQARLVGLEVVQGVANITKVAFNDIINRKTQGASAPAAVIPKEHATVNADFVHDDIRLSKIDYEGEVVALDGSGTVSLSQKLNLELRGGPIEKLTRVAGAFGNVLKEFKDALLVYYVKGTVSNPDISAGRGDGTPIRNLAGKGVDAVGKGVDAVGKSAEKASGFLNNLFKRKDEK